MRSLSQAAIDTLACRACLAEEEVHDDKNNGRDAENPRDDVFAHVKLQ